VALIVGIACSCNKAPAPMPEASKSPQPSPQKSPLSTSSPPAGSPSPAPSDFRYPAPARLVAIGDLHGDLSATRAALKLAGAIDADDHWAGGKLTLVQTGDEIDRADEDRDVLDLFERLIGEAQAAGGRVIALNGNHEIMNVQGDFRYVTPAAAEAFKGVSPRSPAARSVVPPFVDRAAAFLPGGAYAEKLSRRDVIAVVGDSVFAHGGVLPEHVSYGIARINAETRAWMAGAQAQAPAIVASERGPDWVRDFSQDPVSEEECALLGRALDALGAQRMVIGHTVQKSGISSACNDRVYRIDVGLSRFYGGPIQILQITPKSHGNTPHPESSGGSGVEILKAARQGR